MKNMFEESITDPVENCEDSASPVCDSAEESITDPVENCEDSAAPVCDSAEDKVCVCS